MRSFLRELAVTTQADLVQLRDSLRLKALDSTKVVLVTDNVICAKAAAGLNAHLGTPNLIRQLHVAKFGSDFAIKDPDNPEGEGWWPTITLDAKFKYKSSVLSP